MKHLDRKKIITLSALAFYIALLVALFFVVGKPLVSFAGNPEEFRAWVSSYGFLGRLVYAGMVFFQVIVAIVPGEPFEIVGGYAFGVIGGTLWCMIGACAGSIAVFCLVRKFGMRLIEVFFPKEKIQSLRFLRASEKRDALMFLLMLIPGTPKDLLSYVAGITDISILKWLLISSVGRIPSIITSTIGGNAIGTSRITFAIITFAATLAISGIGILIYRAILERRGSAQK